MNQIRYLVLIFLFGVAMVAKSEPEMSFECDEPKKEQFGGLSITITHCIDSSGPDSDGAYEFYYDYETIIFDLGGESISGKRYADTLEEVYLTGIKDLGGERLIEESDLKKEIVKVTLSYLKANGAKSVKYFDIVSGYSEFPSE